MSFLINPFTFAVAADGDFESIATVTLGSDSLPSFTSIPGTYQHLQLRCLMRMVDTTDAATSFYVRFNGDTGSNYTLHNLYGNGSSAAALGFASQTSGWAGYVAASNTYYGVTVVDILDYADTSKNTTIRSFSGVDFNGSGRVALGSSAWLDTDAITSIETYAGGYNIRSGSTLALYGIKAP